MQYWGPHEHARKGDEMRGRGNNWPSPSKGEERGTNRTKTAAGCFSNGDEQHTVLPCQDASSWSITWPPSIGPALRSMHIPQRRCDEPGRGGGLGCLIRTKDRRQEHRLSTSQQNGRSQFGGFVRHVGLNAIIDPVPWLISAEHGTWLMVLGDSPFKHARFAVLD